MFRNAPLAVSLVLAAASSAAAVPITGHTPPHLLKQGTTSRATVPGSVIVQVLVSATGTGSSKRVIKSTNHADDAAALDVAGSSTFVPAVNNGKKSTEFFDFTLKFTGNGVAAAPSGSLASYETMLRANQFAAAKTGLTEYVAQHPTEQKASFDLALADSFLGDNAGAAALFAKADTIPDSMKGAARKALYEASTSDVQAKNFDEALVYAKKAVAVSPDYVSYAALGRASLAANDASGAVSAYEKSRSLATSASAAERATIDDNLVGAYLAAGEPDKAQTSADEAKSLDPKVNAGGAFGQYYSDLAAKKESAGDEAGAATAFQSGAERDPADAVTLFTDAAFAYLKMKPQDTTNAKATADKALALDPTDAGANFAAGVALANAGKTADAIPFLTKADASAKAKGQTSLATQIETNLKAISPTK